MRTLFAGLALSFSKILCDWAFVARLMAICAIAYVVNLPAVAVSCAGDLWDAVVIVNLSTLLVDESDTIHVTRDSRRPIGIQKNAAVGTGHQCSKLMSFRAMALALKRIYCNKPASQTRPYLWRRTAFKRPFIKSQARTRSYATQTSLGRDTSVSTSRKQVTVTSDDGSVRWTDLSAREKAARATQQSFNFLTILTGTVLTGAVVYFLYQEVFSSDSKTRHFNRAVDRVKSDQRCIELLGNSKEIKAYGEPTLSKWARARPIA